MSTAPGVQDDLPPSFPPRSISTVGAGVFRAVYLFALLLVLTALLAIAVVPRTYSVASGVGAAIVANTFFKLVG